MKNNLKNFLLLSGLILALIFVSKKYSNYNLEKSLSACVLYQMKKSSNIKKKDAEEYCIKEIKKSK
tara:strand:+ start:1020 stop:1217 length:198 start_codon:yes stop_codon:yes gene_type:complete